MFNISKTLLGASAILLLTSAGLVHAASTTSSLAINATSSGTAPTTQGGSLDQALNSVNKNLDRQSSNAGLNNAKERLERNQVRHETKEIERVEKTERVEKAERVEKVERPERVERPETIERPERVERPETIERPEHS